MEWKIGQKLVCIQSPYGNTPFPECCPKKDDVVTYDGQSPKGNMYLKEYNIPNPYSSNGIRIAFFTKHFRPLLGNSAKSELISSFIEVAETSDAPIKSPQKETV